MHKQNMTKLLHFQETTLYIVLRLKSDITLRYLDRNSKVQSFGYRYFKH